MGCWSDMLNQVIRPAFAHLRPGGYLESQELMGLLECDDGTVTPTNHFKRWCDDIVEASIAADRPLPFADSMKRWYEEAGFVDVQEKVYKIPINRWPGVQKLKRLGEMFHANMESGLQAFSYALLHRVKGMSQEEIEVGCDFLFPFFSPSFSFLPSLPVLPSCFGSRNKGVGIDIDDDDVTGLPRKCQEGYGRPARPRLYKVLCGVRPEAGKRCDSPV